VLNGAEYSISPSAVLCGQSVDDEKNLLEHL
jgi:hypothetical protein